MSESSELAIREEVRLPATREAFLLENFNRWEKRGRGWEVWDWPVYPEPPFRPFFHYLPRYLNARPVDDGRRPAPESLLLDKIFSWFAPKPATPPAVPEPVPDDDIIIEPEPEVLDADDPIIELEIALPPGLLVTPEISARFLLSLTYCSLPMSYELIGTSDGITVQVTCRERDRDTLRRQLAAYFPEAVITERQAFLYGQWIRCEGDPLVVDFGLSEMFFRSLRTFGSFAVDPLIGLAGALSDIRKEEIALLQVLFQPTRFPWGENILRLVSDGAGGSFFDGGTDLVKAARQKISQPLYGAVIRVASKSPNEGRRLRIAQDAASVLELMASTENRFIPLTNDDYPDELHEACVLSRATFRTGMILNGDELVSLVHLPSASVRSAKLKRQATKSKPAPKLALGHETVLGVNEHEGVTAAVTLSPDQRVKHMHVIGAPGTGKSTFLLNLIMQDIEQVNGLAVLDPHGDLIDQILERVKEERREDVILLNPSDENFPIGFNILSAHSEVEKQLLSSDLVGVFKRLSTSWGDQMTSVLGNAILAFLESEQGGTLADLRRFLVEKSYREEFLKSVKDREVVYYWKKEFPMLTGSKSLGPLLTRLDTFLRPKLIRHMVAQKENKLDFAAMMNGGKIFLAKLSQGAIGEENAYLLGSLLVSKFHQIALSRQEMKETDRRPFYFYIDEFHNFITPSMTQILSGARKYRLGLILAHQELRQLGGTSSEIGASILSNPYARVCFRLGDDDARKLESGFSFFEAKDLQNLGTGEAIARIERAEYDFNLETPPLAPLDEAVGRLNTETILESSRRKYASRKAEVEAELAKFASVDDEDEPPRERPKRKPFSKEQPQAASPAESQPTETSPPSPTSPSSSLSEKPPSLEEALREREVKSPDHPSSSPLSSPAKPSSPPSPAPLGRGGPEHQALQRKISLWAQGMGWKATVENPILDGAGSVDVLLEKADHSVACEISVTSTPDYEVGNIEKCWKARFSEVIVIAEETKRLTKIKDAARASLGEALIERTRFLTPDGFFAFMEELQARTATTEMTSRGYHVTAVFQPQPSAGQTGKRRNVSEMVAGKARKSPDGKKKTD